MKIKEPIQRFSLLQKAIVIFTAIVMVYGAYAYTTKLEDRTVLAKKIRIMLMSDEELQKMEEEKYKKELQEFENEDF